jgi:hypothetical protein
MCAAIWLKTSSIRSNGSEQKSQVSYLRYVGSLSWTATKPIRDENGIMAQTPNIFNARGIFWDTPLGQEAVQGGVAGSYAINGYCLAIPMNSTFENGSPAKDGFR